MNIRNLLPKQQTIQGYIVCNSIKFVAISLCCYFGHFSFKYSRRKIQLEDFRSILFIYNNCAILFGILTFPFCCCCIILDSMKEEEKNKKKHKVFLLYKIYIYIQTYIFLYRLLHLNRKSWYKRIPQVSVSTNKKTENWSKKGWRTFHDTHTNVVGLGKYQSK